MNDKTDKNTEKTIVVSINGKEVNSIPLKDMIKRKRTVKDIVMQCIEKDPDIKKAEQFFVFVNNKKIKPKDVRNVHIENVRTIDIFDKVPEESIEK